MTQGISAAKTAPFFCAPVGVGRNLQRNRDALFGPEDRHVRIEKSEIVLHPVFRDSFAMHKSDRFRIEPAG